MSEWHWAPALVMEGQRLGVKGMNGPTPCSDFDEHTPLDISVQQYRPSICMHNLDCKYSVVFLAACLPVHKHNLTSKILVPLGTSPETSTCQRLTS